MNNTNQKNEGNGSSESGLGAKNKTNMKNTNNRWFTLTVTLTDAGASKYRCDGISNLGSDQALDGFGSLLATKHAIQAASPADYKAHYFKVRGDDVGRVMSEMAKTLRVGWEMIENIKIEETL